MHPNEFEPISTEPKVPLTREVLTRSVILIIISLAAGAFLVWIVTFEFVLTMVAFLLQLLIGLLGFFIGNKVFKIIGKTYPDWVRLTVAIIVGFAVTITIAELTRSHKLIRISEHVWSSSEDE